MRTEEHHSARDLERAEALGIREGQQGMLDVRIDHVSGFDRNVRRAADLPALVVDDVLTSGGSVLKAIAAAREAGLQVQDVLVIVDRKEQDGRARIEQEQVRVRSLLTIDDLMKARS